MFFILVSLELFLESSCISCTNALSHCSYSWEAVASGTQMLCLSKGKAQAKRVMCASFGSNIDALPVHHPYWCITGPSSAIQAHPSPQQAHTVLYRPTQSTSGPHSPHQAQPVPYRPTQFTTGPPSAIQAHPVHNRPTLCQTGPPNPQQAHPVPYRPTQSTTGPPSSQQAHPVHNRPTQCHTGPSSWKPSRSEGWAVHWLCKIYNRKSFLICGIGTDDLTSANSSAHATSVQPIQKKERKEQGKKVGFGWVGGWGAGGGGEAIVENLQCRQRLSLRCEGQNWLFSPPVWGGDN